MAHSEVVNQSNSLPCVLHSPPICTYLPACFDDFLLHCHWSKLHFANLLNTLPVRIQGNLFIPFSYTFDSRTWNGFICW